MKKMNRREALRLLAFSAAASLISCKREDPEVISAVPTLEPTEVPTNSPTELPAPAAATTQPTTSPTQTPEVTLTPASVKSDKPIVYMTTQITADALVKLYEALGRKAHGTVAVKISSGEPGGHHFLAPDLIKPLVSLVEGTIVECNVAYGGRRGRADSHLQVLEDHGFTAIAPVDVMDADGTVELSITGGTHLEHVVVGSHFIDYDFVVNLAHFKGHAMAGFGGVIKNMAIGIASSKGKSLIHSAGKSSFGLGLATQRDHFLEAMTEGAKGMAEHLGENIIYINVMNHLSVDCDCDGSPAAPTMADIGMLASLDPVALDQACVDLVYAASDSADLIKRMESRNGIHALEHAEAIGFGSREYQLVELG